MLFLKATVDDLNKMPKQPSKKGLAEQMFARTVLYAKMVGAKKAIDDYNADTKPAPASGLRAIPNWKSSAVGVWGLGFRV